MPNHGQRMSEAPRAVFIDPFAPKPKTPTKATPANPSPDWMRAPFTTTK